VGKDARWWHASGVDVRLDSNGFKLNTQSLAGLLVGGLAFETSKMVTNPEAAAPNGSNFPLGGGRGQRACAIPTVEVGHDGAVFRPVAAWPGSRARTVDFRGIVLGEVRSVGVEFDPVKKNFRMPVTVNLYPARLGRRFQKTVVDDQDRNAWTAGAGADGQRAACVANCGRGIC
jgi:paraquat-inducible protein B